MSKAAKILHGRRPCKSCPFRVQLGAGAFPPDVLDATIGENLRREQHVHKCHRGLGKQVEPLCVGFMRYLIANEIPNSAFRFGVRLRVIDPTVFDETVEILTDWDDVLENHAAALATSPNVEEPT